MRSITIVAIILFLGHSLALPKFDKKPQRFSFSDEDVQKIEPMAVEEAMVDIASKDDNITHEKSTKLQRDSSQSDDDNNQQELSDKCQLELSVVGGTCFVNKQKIKPTVLLSVGGGRRKNQNKQSWISNEWTPIEGEGLTKNMFNRSGKLFLL